MNGSKLSDKMHFGSHYGSKIWRLLTIPYQPDNTHLKMQHWT